MGDIFLQSEIDLAGTQDKPSFAFPMLDVFQMLLGPVSVRMYMYEQPLTSIKQLHE